MTLTIAPQSSQPLTVNRLGCGTDAPARPRRVGRARRPAPEPWTFSRAAVAGGVNFLDTADYYGDDVTNRLIAEALYPYPPTWLSAPRWGPPAGPIRAGCPSTRPPTCAPASSATCAR
ncbi:MAG: hypothetical protein WKG07_17930 [Hymenobacter sp.]